MKIKLHSPLTNSSGSSTEAKQAELELEWSTRWLVYVFNTIQIQNPWPEKYIPLIRNPIGTAC